MDIEKAILNAQEDVRALKEEYVVWSWGDRKVAYGKVVEQDEHVITIDFKAAHHLILPKGSFKFDFFDSEKKAQKFLGE